MKYLVPVLFAALFFAGPANAQSPQEGTPQTICGDYLTDDYWVYSRAIFRTFGVEVPTKDCPMFDNVEDDFFPTDDSPWNHPLPAGSPYTFMFDDPWSID